MNSPFIFNFSEYIDISIFSISQTTFFEISFLLNNYPMSCKTLSSKKNQNFVPVFIIVYAANISLANSDFINQLQILIQVFQLCFFLPKVASTEKEPSSLQSKSDYSPTECNISSNLTLGPYVILYDSPQFCIFHIGSAQ